MRDGGHGLRVMEALLPSTCVTTDAFYGQGLGCPLSLERINDSRNIAFVIQQLDMVF